MALRCESYEVREWGPVKVQENVLMAKVVLRVAVAYHDGGGGGCGGVEEEDEVVELEKV